MKESERKLVALLHSIAMYNDKGIQWMGHSENQIQRQRDEFRAALDHLIRGLEPGALNQIVLSGLQAESVLHDGDGKYADEVELWFTKHKLDCDG